MALSAGSVHRDPDERIARLEDRYRNEDMSAEERCELRDRILKIKAAGAMSPRPPRGGAADLLRTGVHESRHAEGARRPDGSTRYSGRCVGCHHAYYGMKRTANRPAPDAVTRRLSAEPCVRCGWADAPTDRHRLEKERDYVAGKCVPLCPNRHRLVTLGLALLPEGVLR